MINVTRLHQSLVDAGVPIDGVSSNGRIDFRPEATTTQKALAAQILAAHDPSKPTTQEQTLMDAQSALKALNAKKPSALTVTDFQALFKLFLVEHGWAATDGTIQIP